MNSELKIRVDTFLVENYPNLTKMSKCIVKGQLAEDILSDSIIDLYSMPEWKIEKYLETKTLTYVIAGMINNKNYDRLNKVKSSPYSSHTIDNTSEYLFNNDNNSEIDEELDQRIEKELKEDAFLDNINNILHVSCSWFDREVFLRYTNIYDSFTIFSIKTDIPKSTLWSAYNRARKILKENY